MIAILPAKQASAHPRRPTKQFIGPPRPTLLQQLERQIAAQPGRFSAGAWLAGLTDDELQQVEAAAHRHRGNILSFLFEDPLKVSLIASCIQDAEGVARVNHDNFPPQAQWTQNLVLKTLVQAVRMARQGLLVIQGEPSMREDAQPTFVLTAAGLARGATLPDLAAAHAWRTPTQVAWDSLAEEFAKPRAACPTCGRSVPA